MPPSPNGRWFRRKGEAPWIMGVLNCTPDSFSDGGRYVQPEKAVAHGLALWRAGAAIVDVGGESTRPGAAPVPVEEELARVIPVVEALAAQGVFVSIDTQKPEVMAKAVEAGARMINDVNALRAPGALEVAASCDADVVLMHMQGTPQTMQKNPHYDDVVDEVTRFLEARMETCVQAGIEEARLIVDPGIGFGKRLEHNLALIAHLDRIRARLGRPLLLGVSRKSMLGMLTDAPVHDREFETAAVDAIGVWLGADGLRVHDVRAQAKAARVAAALADARRD